MTETPILALLGPPPGALQVRASLERIEVTLPPYLRGRAVILGLLAAAVMVAYRLTQGEHPDVERWVIQAAVALSAFLLLLWAQRGLTGRLARGCREHLLVLAALAVTIPILYCCASPSYVGHYGQYETPVEGVFQGSMLAALGCAILAQVAREAPMMAIDTVKLEIFDRGRRRLSVPLDGIRSIERQPWSGRVQINGETVPALSRLPEREWGWIEALLEEHIAQRKAALIRQGHDLGAPPPGLAEVQATRERS